LIICARGEDALEATRAAIEGECGGRVVAVPADLSQPDQLLKVVDAGINEFGGIDILVTNTGGPPAGPFESHSPEAWREAVVQNLESVLNLTRAVLPGMKERRWGRIINVTSIAVKQPVDSLIFRDTLAHSGWRS
jgi:3-oxoacyl-[acyl-carrier protein] reductase